MTCKNEDRERSITVGFRTTPEVDHEITFLAKACGMTKQDYITARLLNQEVVMNPSRNTYVALRNEIRNLCKQLNRFRSNENLPESLLHLCELVFDIFMGLRGDKTEADVEIEDAFIMNMKREI